MVSPVTPGSDRARRMPSTPAARQDDIAAARRSLAAERRRLERLGLEPPLARCQEEVRYWDFLAALHSLPTRSGPLEERGGFTWPDAHVP
jgi:hypothetical protein